VLRQRGCFALAKARECIFLIAKNLLAIQNVSEWWLHCGMPPHLRSSTKAGMGFFSRFFKIREQDPDSAETTWAMEDNGSELVLDPNTPPR
jgi:hypothetical protein